MKKLLTALEKALTSGESAVLCSIIASSGSTPRGSGAKMAVFSGGGVLGTVGGGAVEYHSIRLAREALQSGQASIRSFNLSHGQNADIGMVCGGQVTILFQFFAAGDSAALELVRRALPLLERHEPAWLVCRIESGAAQQMALLTNSGLFPELCPLEGLQKLAGKKAVLSDGEPAYYVEPLSVPGRALLFGGGHISQQLAPLLCKLDFAVTLYEDRREFATAELFPTVEQRILGEFTGISRHLSISVADYAIIMTRGHQYDFELLRQVLATPACYVGVIGSRHKIAHTNARLREAGVADADIQRIHTPIGLEIGAETPAEIAVSIAAELILHRSRLTEQKG